MQTDVVFSKILKLAVGIGNAVINSVFELLLDELVSYNQRAEKTHFLFLRIFRIFIVFSTKCILYK